MLDVLAARLPRHSLLAADFDVLPPPSLRPAAGSRLHADGMVASHKPAIMSPLVASKDAEGTHALVIVSCRVVWDEGC